MEEDEDQATADQREIEGVLVQNKFDRSLQFVVPVERGGEKVGRTSS